MCRFTLQLPAAASALATQMSRTKELKTDQTLFKLPKITNSCFICTQKLENISLNWIS